MLVTMTPGATVLTVILCFRSSSAIKNYLACFVAASLRGGIPAHWASPRIANFDATYAEESRFPGETTGVR